MINNEEKHNNYIILKSKLKKALKNEFWFEACMIEYSIIEDRTSSILSHAKICDNAYDSNKKLSNKLNSILQQIGKKHPIIFDKVSKNNIEQILIWKDKRNDLVHRACNISYDFKMPKEIAIEGKLLVEKISNDSQKVKRLANKMYLSEAI